MNGTQYLDVIRWYLRSIMKLQCQRDNHRFIEALQYQVVLFFPPRKTRKYTCRTVNKCWKSVNVFLVMLISGHRHKNFASFYNSQYFWIIPFLVDCTYSRRHFDTYNHLLPLVQAEILPAKNQSLYFLTNFTEFQSHSNERPQLQQFPVDLNNFFCARFYINTPLFWYP